MQRTRCTRCIKHHKVCDMARPVCGRCKDKGARCEASIKWISVEVGKHSDSKTPPLPQPTDSLNNSPTNTVREPLESLDNKQPPHDNLYDNTQSNTVQEPSNSPIQAGYKRRLWDDEQPTKINPTNTPAATQDSLQGDGCTEPVSGVLGTENFRVLYLGRLAEAARLACSIGDLKSGLNSATASRKRKNTNHNPISIISSNEVSTSSISSHTISPSSPRDASSPLLAASFSERHALHALIDVPERNQVSSTIRAVISPNAYVIPSDTNYLLLMFHILDICEIPYTLFERVRSPQYRWTNDGDQTQITALEAGLDQRLVDLLSDETRLTQTIDKLEPLVKRNISTEGSWTCSIHTQLKSKLSQSLSEWTRDEWAIKFLKWVCFVFPRDQFPSDPDQSLSVGKQLLPLLILALGQLSQKDLPTCVRDDAAGALLAASKIGDMPSRQDAVALATKILGDQPPEHLQVALAHQKSTLLRIVAKWEQSEQVIQELCRRTAGLDHSGDVIHRFYRHLQPNMKSKRLNALYGRLHVSHLENLLQSEHYKTAKEDIEDWKISQEPSLMEQCVFRSKAVVVAKLFRCQGRFHDVIHTLEECLKLPFPQMNRIQLICNLADAHSDLGSPDVAHAHLKAEIEAQRKKSARGKQFRRLWICAIDADLERGEYDSAQKFVQEIETVYSGLSDLDATDQLLHVRVLLAAARIHFYKEQFSEALGSFTVLIDRVQEYRSLKSDGFVYALAHLSICLVNLKTGNVGECKKTFDYARTIIYKEWPDFWIPTAPRWLRYVSLEINSMMGWTLTTRTPLISDASGAFLTNIT